MAADQRQALQTYLDRPLDELMEELALYDVTTRSVGETWSKLAGPLHQRLCIEWGWCQVRQDARFENDLDLAAAVLVTLTAHVLLLPVPAELPLVAVIAVKR